MSQWHVHTCNANSFRGADSALLETRRSDAEVGETEHSKWEEICTLAVDSFSLMQRRLIRTGIQMFTCAVIKPSAGFYRQKSSSGFGRRRYLQDQSLLLISHNVFCHISQQAGTDCTSPRTKPMIYEPRRQAKTPLNTLGVTRCKTGIYFQNAVDSDFCL